MPWCNMKKECNNSEEKAIVNLSFVTCSPTLPVCPHEGQGVTSFTLTWRNTLYMRVPAF